MSSTAKIILKLTVHGAEGERFEGTKRESNDSNRECKKGEIYFLDSTVVWNREKELKGENCIKTRRGTSYFECWSDDAVQKGICQGRCLWKRGPKGKKKLHSRQEISLHYRGRKGFFTSQPMNAEKRPQKAKIG